MFTSIFVFLIVISILVLIHEFGHFIVARRAGIWVEEFGFGIPPRVFGKKIGETIYSLNLLPFGGFVRLHGENSEEDITDPERAFLGQSKKTRAVVITAGVLMNLILAVVCFVVVYLFSGIPRETDKVGIIEIASGSPAEVSGFKVGDIIKKVDGKDIKGNDDFVRVVSDGIGRDLVFTIQRSGDQIEIKAVPRRDPPRNEGPLGVVISTTEIYYPPLWQRPFYGIYYGLKEAFFWTGVVVGGFIQLFQQIFQGTLPEEIAGPVGIFVLTSKAASYGILTLINFVGILSVNLAILNIIPFPALDGGRFLFVMIESVFGKRLVPKIENLLHSIGMVILLFLLLAVTYNDMRRLIEFGGISGFIEKVLK